MFLEHGTAKVLGFRSRGRACARLRAGASARWSCCSAHAGAGLFTRPVAFLAAGFCAVGYWMIHGPQSPYPIINGGELIALYCFVFLYICVAGPGPWSVDAMRGGRRRR